MLVLSRNEDESIRIGADVVVTIRKIKGNQVRVAIDAPRAVKVLRTELEERREVRGQRSEDRGQGPGVTSENDGNAKRQTAAA